jgi:LPS-assembly lipoprotein
MWLFKPEFRVQGSGFGRNFSAFILRPIYIIIAIFSLQALYACGFKPMYAQNADNSEISAKLSSVEVKSVKTLIGQEYVVALKDVLDPGHIGAVPLYTIEVNVNTNTLPLAIAQNRTVSRYKVVVTVDYTLKEIATGKVLSKGLIKNEDDYDSVSSYYATYVSDNESGKRAARELAHDTKIKIIAALSGGGV